MRIYSSTWLMFSCCVGVLGCGDNGGVSPDAKSIDTPMIDAPSAPDVTWNEGGETLIEYQRIYVNATTTNVQARFTTYYWRALDPLLYPPPTNPGCNKTGLDTPNDDSDDHFPMGMGHVATAGGPASHTYIDVGQPTVTGGTMPMVTPLGVNPGFDGFHRKHDGIYHFVAGANMGDTYLNASDAPYSLTLAGSSEWPAQQYDNAFYMPPAWTPVAPAFGPVTAVMDTPIVVQWSTPNPTTNRPADGALNMVVALIVPGVGPVVECRDDNPTVHTQLTIPADMVNYYRGVLGAATGNMARAIVSHRIKELTDGTTHNHKRMDFISTWCYVVPATAP